MQGTKHLRWVLFLMAMGAVTWGCEKVHGASKTSTVEKKLVGFTKVAVSHTCEMELHKQAKFSVTASIDEEYRADLIVEKRGDLLYVGLRDGRYFSNVHCRAKVGMPRLEGIEVSGAARVRAGDFGKLQDLHLQTSGVGSLRLRADIRHLHMQSSGASRIHLAGTAQKVEGFASGSSRVYAAQLVAPSAKVHLSGSSRMEIHVKTHLRAHLSGASSLYHKGSPQIQQHTSGVARVSSM